MFTRAARLAATCVAMLYLFVGCSGGDSPTEPVARVDSVSVTGVFVGVQSDPVMVGSTTQVFVKRLKSNGAEESVALSEVTLSFTGPVSVSSDGRVTAIAQGVAEIKVTMGKFESVVVLTVMPKPLNTAWTSMSQEARDYLQASNFSNSGLKRLVVPAKIWGDSTVRKTFDLEKVAKVWPDSTNGDVSVVVVEDSTSANIWLVFDPTMPTPDAVIPGRPCALASGIMSPNNEIIGGIVRFATPVPGCTYLAVPVHELGHIIFAFAVHRPTGADFMSSPGKSKFSAVLAEATHFIATQPLGWKP